MGGPKGNSVRIFCVSSSPLTLFVWRGTICGKILRGERNLGCIFWTEQGTRAEESGRSCGGSRRWPLPCREICDVISKGIVQKLDTVIFALRQWSYDCCLLFFACSVFDISCSGLLSRSIIFLYSYKMN